MELTLANRPDSGISSLALYLPLKKPPASWNWNVSTLCVSRVVDGYECLPGYKPQDPCHIWIDHHVSHLLHACSV
jgi:hypothetical protein